MSYKVFFLFLGFCIIFSVTAQDASQEIDDLGLYKSSEPGPLTLTIDDAVSQAIDANLSVKQSEIQLRTKQRNNDRLWNYYIPKLNVSAAIARATQPTQVKSEQGHWSAQFGASATLDLSLQLISALDMLRTDLLLGNIEYQEAKRTLERSVRQAFYNLLYRQESIKLAEKNVNSAQKIYNQAKINYQNGLVPELTVLTSQVQLENYKPALVDEQNLYQVALLEFRMAIGLDLDQEIALEGSLETNYTIDFSTYSRSELFDRLDIKSLKAQGEMLRAQRQSEIFSRFTPTLSMGYNYNPLLPDFQQGTNWNDLGKFNVSLFWSLDGLIPFGTNWTVLAAKRDELESNRLSVSLALQKAETEVRSLSLSLTKSIDLLGALQASVELAQKTYDLTNQAFRSGQKELLEVDDAATSLQRAELNVLKELYNFQVNLLDWQYALSLPLGM